MRSIRERTRSAAAVSKIRRFEVAEEVWHVVVVLQDVVVVIFGAFGRDSRVGCVVPGNQLAAYFLETV